jgi:hypothetical protein
MVGRSRDRPVHADVLRDQGLPTTALCLRSTSPCLLSGVLNGTPSLFELEDVEALCVSVLRQNALEHFLTSVSGNRTGEGYVARE